TFLAKVWNAGTGVGKLVLPGPRGLSPLPPQFGLAVSISPDGKFLAAINTGEPGITIWDLPDQKVLTRLPDKRFLTCFQFSPDGKTLATGSFSGVVNLWDVTTGGEPLLRIKAHSDPVFAAAFCREVDILVIASQDQTVKL